MQMVVVVGDYTLEGHGPIKWTKAQPTPSSILSKVTLANNLHQLIIHLQRRTKDQKPALRTIVLHTPVRHIVIPRKERIDFSIARRQRRRYQRIAERDIDPAAAPIARRTVDHDVVQRIQRLEQQRVQIEMHHDRMLHERVRVQFDEFFFAAASVGGDLRSEVVALDFGNGDGIVPEEYLVPQRFQCRSGAGFGGGVDEGVHFIIVATFVSLWLLRLLWGCVSYGV
mmetsp:Transcript_40873/g.85879  ORF Transcript_40873/g.85879 Transcript_40873/m.85879 type:complete len:226 (+) Transcript_40873:926-1603(+)